jgi:tRNA-specific 2-thiouridylase
MNGRDYLNKKTLIVGDVNSGKTTLCRKILEDLCRQGLGERIAVIDLAPEIPEGSLRNRGLKGVGGRLQPPAGSGAAWLHAPVIAPRLTSSSEAEALEKAGRNREAIEILLKQFEASGRDILFVNDVSLYLQAGDPERLAGLLDRATTAVVNGYLGEKLGPGELSRRERKAMEKMAEWFRSFGSVITMFREGPASGTILVAMSGGVDSSVAALLLVERGFDIAGLTLFRQGDESAGYGPRDVEDAAKVCRMLGIPHHAIDFTRDLERLVINPFLEEYRRGRTPNPCVLCNRDIKFGMVLEKARQMGCGGLATGHYARIADRGGKPALAVPKDRRKDQTYFLYRVRREALGQIHFPLGEYTKQDIRKLATRAGLPVSLREDSQDVCFIPRGGIGPFLEARLSDSGPGRMVDGRGQVVGTHRGIIHYTIGQRARLSAGRGDLLYVVSIDPAENLVVVGPREALRSRGLEAGDVNLLVDEMPAAAHAKIRYAHRPAPCRVEADSSSLTVIFDEPQEGVTPGQSVVLYEDGVVLGGGTIRRASNGGESQP